MSRKESMRKIAVIGSGISGMAAAYLLNPTHHVTLYEKNDCLGGHARTKRVEYRDKHIDVDTGFIVFNHVNYPELTAMLHHLDVKTQESDMSFGFTLCGSDFEWGAFSLNSVFAQRSNLLRPSFYAMIYDVLRFFKHAPSVLNQTEDITLGAFLTRLKVGTRFKEQFLLPLGAAIWSCPAEAMLQFPARTFVQFFKNHGLLSLNGQHQWYTVSGGSQRYIDKIKGSLGEIRLSSGVKKVWREGDKIMVHSNGADVAYDEVVFAAHADETLNMLQDATALEKDILGAFHYQPNTAYLHRDASVMPKRKRCWASWSYMADKAHNLSVSYWMNRLQSIDQDYPLFVTLNPVNPINPNMIFDVHEYSHPIFTREAMAAQPRISEIQGTRGIWFCGAYQRYGFHEDGLLSAIRVVQAMGGHIPWH
jgi:predicted NAD/FAD-binding protein